MATYFRSNAFLKYEEESSFIHEVVSRRTSCRKLRDAASVPGSALIDTIRMFNPLTFDTMANFTFRELLNNTGPSTATLFKFPPTRSPTVSYAIRRTDR